MKFLKNKKYLYLYEKEIKRQRDENVYYVHEISFIKLYNDEDIFVCDRNVATGLNYLNLLEYKTLASCEGHLIE